MAYSDSDSVGGLFADLIIGFAILSLGIVVLVLSVI
jgi:hypothetical protein